MESSGGVCGLAKSVLDLCRLSESLACSKTACGLLLSL